MTFRASKAGYDAVERTIHAAADAYVGEIQLRSSYGACLTSFVPVLVDRVASAGQIVAINVAANSDRTWTASSPDSWIEVPAGAHTGSGTQSFRVQSYQSAL